MQPRSDNVGVDEYIYSCTCGHEGLDNWMSFCPSCGIKIDWTKEDGG